MPDDKRQSKNIEDDADANPLLRMEIDLYEHSRQRAIASGAIEADSAELSALEAHAAAMARGVYRDEYDPKNNHGDAGREEEHKRVKKERAEANACIRIGEAEIRDREAALTRLPPAGDRPHPDPHLTIAGLAALLLSIAPTVHDLLAGTIEDALLCWFLAALASSGVAALVTLAILRSASSPEAGGTLKHPGLVAGVVVGLGLCLFRLSGVESWLEALTPIGLTLLELGVVILLEWHAEGLRRRLVTWRERQDAIEQATADRDSVRQLVAEQRGRVESLSTHVTMHLRYVEHRRICHAKADDIEATAVKAVGDGYHAGLAENRGRAYGLRRAGASR